MLPDIGTVAPWTDPGVTALRRLPMHVPLPTDGAGRDRRSLDGRWAFRLFGSPDEVTRAAVAGSTARWHTVAVPGNWTMQDVGDRPHYTNVQMPFPGPPPRLSEHNPTGVYRRSVTVPAAWRGRQVVLHVGGAESVHAVWVNGAFAGYGTDSRLASEYDVTPFVHTGRNEIAIVVVRYSAMSYVEDQDQWWHAGLHRSVWVEARDTAHLYDVNCSADVDPGDGVGRLTVRTVTGWASAPLAGHRVRVSLFGPDGRRVGAPSVQLVPHDTEQFYVFRGHHTTHEFVVPKVQPWSAESPTRYRVKVDLLGARSRVVDSTHQLVGFRRVEVRGRDLLVNGRRIWIFGVNRHDHHPDRGKALTIDDMRADLLTMRRHNITAVRTSHYPDDPAFYDLCDELGMYVVDEANLESHAHIFSLCDDPRWRETWVERGARMVARDRNHPSVIMWSLGNESGSGVNHRAQAAWVRRADPTRPLHYEGPMLAEGLLEGHDLTDVACPMYSPIEVLQWYSGLEHATRPFILCEYSHAMGNSNGSLADYWDAISSSPGLQGGFIWEWKDHGLRMRMPDGSTRLAYGGMFGDVPNDVNFVLDGLVDADGVPHPAMREVAWVYRPVAVSAGRSGRLRITNRQAFSGLDGLRAEWQLLVDGEERRRGVLRVPSVDPLSAVEVDLPCAVPAGEAAVHLVVRWTMRSATAWAEAGHLVAWDEVEVRRAPRRSSSAGPPRLPVGATPARVSFECEPSVWRAPTDNDGIKLSSRLSELILVGAPTLSRWLRQGLDVRPAGEIVRHSVRRVDTGDGVEFHHTFVVPEEYDDLPRVGVRAFLPRRFGSVRWCGRGPHENYPDRNRAAVHGVWEAEPDRLPYVLPQEFGLRTDTRWLELRDPGRGDVVRIDVLRPTSAHLPSFHFSATHHTAEDMWASTHAADLQPRRQLVLHLDAAHRGVGTASCGPDTLPKYRIGPGTYRLSFLLRTFRR